MTSDKLYGLAFEYKKTKLWNHLSDTQVFALELSGGRVGYISIMGRAGGHCALGLFIGDEGFNSFRVIAQADPMMMSQLEFHEHLIQQTCLQCIFENYLKAKMALPRKNGKTPGDMPAAMESESAEETRIRIL